MQIGNGIFLVNPFIVGGVSFDPDAQAFITAASITDPTQQSAVNQLVVDLKAASLWTKMKRIYPMVGGTSTTHKYCLKSLTNGIFYGGMSHTSSGIIPNASNSYFDTGFKDSDFISYNNYSFGIYTPTTGSGFYDMGVQTSNSSNRNLIIANNSGTGYYSAFTNYFNTFSPANGLLSVNYYDGYLGSSVGYDMFKNGTYSVRSSVGMTTTTSGNSFYICALNDNGTPSGYSNKTISFAYFCDKLTYTDLSNLYTAVQTFQTTLGRNV